jgi:hypothetical protein
MRGDRYRVPRFPEWPTSDLLAAGGDNVLTFSVSGGRGVMYDALRMEISSTGANPTTTNWHDYEYITPTTDTATDDAVANNYADKVPRREGENSSRWGIFRTAKDSIDSRKRRRI